MSVRIRLRRMGKKKQPHYRIVVADSRAPRDGRFVENLGYYNPLKHPAGLKVDIDRVDYWIGEGAIPSATVKSLVSQARSAGSGDPEANGAAPGAGEQGAAGEAAEEAPAGEDAAGEAASEPSAKTADAKPAGESAAEESSVEESADNEASATDASDDEKPPEAAPDA